MQPNSLIGHLVYVVNKRLDCKKNVQRKKEHGRKKKKEIHIFVYIYIYTISIFVSSLWHAHIRFFCGFLMKSPVPIQLSKCSSVNIRHASMNTMLFHRSLRLICNLSQQPVPITITLYLPEPDLLAKTLISISSQRPEDNS